MRMEDTAHRAIRAWREEQEARARLGAFFDDAAQYLWRFDQRPCRPPLAKAEMKPFFGIANVGHAAAWAKVFKRGMHRLEMIRSAQKDIAPRKVAGDNRGTGGEG